MIECTNRHIVASAGFPKEYYCAILFDYSKSQTYWLKSACFGPVIINTFAIEHSSITLNGIIVSLILIIWPSKQVRCSLRQRNKKLECWKLMPDDLRRHHVGLERISESQNADPSGSVAPSNGESWHHSLCCDDLSAAHCSIFCSVQSHFRRKPQTS